MVISTEGNIKEVESTSASCESDNKRIYAMPLALYGKRKEKANGESVFDNR